MKLELLTRRPHTLRLVLADSFLGSYLDRRSMAPSEHARPLDIRSFHLMAQLVVPVSRVNTIVTGQALS